ncbi:LytR family transcriptional regulator [Anaerobacillus alkalidiazotrophicus]|uniref:Polyisoprenyl-teichoic acid--peptidoglycan teichoic acid transferase TagU n=1 Tax=Anaerobacillus alkalidiazotrophicus TaxID=472963 RepID=A0A1S2MB02_9BACI|nr:LCP family protein [Anaerobacillus alkalidiazotrophicus]OIJ21736.1 LytR family transcriptional regulator [Anaerobacillus alkalidiazotrophicus]
MTKRKKLFIILSLIIGLPLLGLLGYGYHLYSSVVKTVDTMHQPIERESKREIEVNMEEKQPLSFLLLGIDARGTERGRTDTLIVLTVNPNTESMKMLSIPRDTRTEMIGRGFDDKINHAYAFGGPEMTIATVENFLDIPIDYYMTINMEGFKDIVDAVGGVTVDNPFEFGHSGYTFKKGTLSLDGSQALAYSRMRYEDPRGDHGRNDRQRQIMNEIIKEGAQISSVTRVEEILGAIGNNVRTDLDLDKMMKIQSNYKGARRSSEEVTISGSGAMMGGVWYYIVSEEERLRVSNLLKEHLEIE